MTLVNPAPGTRVKVEAEVVGTADNGHFLIKFRGASKPIRVHGDVVSPADKLKYALNEIDFTESRTILSKNIRRYRQKANMSQAMLAEAVGVSQNAVSQWETDCCAPRVYLMPAVCEALGVSVSDLLREDEK